jgi:hypothetical protein
MPALGASGTAVRARRIAEAQGPQPWDEDDDAMNATLLQVEENGTAVLKSLIRFLFACGRHGALRWISVSIQSHHRNEISAHRARSRTVPTRSSSSGLFEPDSHEMAVWITLEP